MRASAFLLLKLSHKSHSFTHFCVITWNWRVRLQRLQNKGYRWMTCQWHAWESVKHIKAHRRPNRQRIGRPLPALYLRDQSVIVRAWQWTTLNVCLSVCLSVFCIQKRTDCIHTHTYDYYCNNYYYYCHYHFGDCWASVRFKLRINDQNKTLQRTSTAAGKCGHQLMIDSRVPDWQ